LARAPRRFAAHRSDGQAREFTEILKCAAPIENGGKRKNGKMPPSALGTQNHQIPKNYLNHPPRQK